MRWVVGFFCLGFSFSFIWIRFCMVFVKFIVCMVIFIVLVKVKMRLMEFFSFGLRFWEMRK